MKKYLIIGNKKINISKLVKRNSLENLLMDMKIETIEQDRTMMDVVFTGQNNEFYYFNERLKNI
jgi:hypothetical protein